jgi:outer membrane protein assembly factor BamA
METRMSRRTNSFEYMVGPTRERYSRLEKRLPFVAADLEEGTHLVQRFYVAEGFLNAEVDPPRDNFRLEAVRSLLRCRFTKADSIFLETSRLAVRQFTVRRRSRQISDLLQRPYTELRVEDIPRRLEAYFKARGYYDVKVVANRHTGRGSEWSRSGAHRCFTGAVYHFDGVTVTGLRRLHPGFVTKRFTRLEGKTYSPDVLDERFRTLMKTGQFNLLQIKPVPVDGHLLRLDISAEEAKSKEFGFWGGFDTYEGALAGVQVGDRDLFGYGRPLTATIEVSQRSYRGEILYEDPFFFDTDFVFTAKAFALTFDYDGYTKFEVGGRLELSRKITNMTRRR